MLVLLALLLALGGYAQQLVAFLNAASSPCYVVQSERLFSVSSSGRLFDETASQSAVQAVNACRDTLTVLGCAFHTHTTAASLRFRSSSGELDVPLASCPQSLTVVCSAVSP
jgi:hypothetical protein